MTDPQPLALARLERNARHFQPDPQLDRAVELFYSDREAWNRLPAQLRSQTGIYEDFREQYRAAVRAASFPPTAGARHDPEGGHDADDRPHAHSGRP